MTTLDSMDGLPTAKEYLAYRLSKYLYKRRERTLNNNASFRVTALVNAIVRVVLHVAGFALLTTAAFQWNIIAGWAVAGISCFVISTLMTGTTSNDERNGNGMVR